MSENRVYVLTAFRPSNQLTSIPTHTHLRLFAIEITRTITERIKVVWQYDLMVNGLIPYMYLNTSETMCTLVPPAPGVRNGAAAKKSETQNIGNISNVMVERGHIIASVNLLGLGSFQESLLLSVTNNGSGCALNFMKPLTGFIQSLSYSSTDPGRVRQQEGLTFWVSRIDLLHSDTLLEERDCLTGILSTLVDLNQILQSSSTVTSTKLTLLQIGQEKTSKLQFGSQNLASPSATALSVNRSSILPLIVGVVSDSTDNVVLALDVSSKSPNATLLWKLPLSVTDGAAVGQITTVNRAEDSLMIVTTPVRINAYLLTY